ncbi:uncharacterized protein [Musca autumnalis]|uniref:uncharacterized protein n=1 Tax=Musca autumnalis TaxID=221902 RepID=UPI003CF0836F
MPRFCDCRQCKSKHNQESDSDSQMITKSKIENKMDIHRMIAYLIVFVDLFVPKVGNSPVLDAQKNCVCLLGWSLRCAKSVLQCPEYLPTVGNTIPPDYDEYDDGQRQISGSPADTTELTYHDVGGPNNRDENKFNNTTTYPLTSPAEGPNTLDETKVNDMATFNISPPTTLNDETEVNGKIPQNSGSILLILRVIVWFTIILIVIIFITLLIAKT